ncbi:MAG: LLM class flavin-dependent oxidoreductase [Caulobacterales bacterium]
MDQRSSTNPLFGPNRLKLGTFCTNTALSLTTVPDLWSPTWPNIIAAARLADDAGLEAIVPIARWKGYVDADPAHVTHKVQEAFTFAAAVAQATSHASIFATSHAPMMHPLVVAKQAATIDHISGGRFALNVVGGWNRREFEMFGIDLVEHSQRYAFLREWLGIVRSLWTEDGEMDIASRHFTMKKAVLQPKPIQRPGPPIMNAGLSSAGMAFAAENSDIAFVSLNGDNPDLWRSQVAEYKALAREKRGVDLRVWTNVHIIQHESVEAALAERTRFADTFRDHQAVEGFLTTIMAESGVPSDPAVAEMLRSRLATGTGYPLVGDAATIAAQLKSISDSGIDGALLGFVNFLDGLPLFLEHVVPKLEASGLRAPHHRGSRA